MERALRARVSMQMCRRRPARPNISSTSGFCARSFTKSRSTAAYAVAKTWLVISMSASAGRRRRASAVAKRPLGFDGAPGNGPKPAITTRKSRSISSSCKHGGDLFYRRRGREPAGGDVGLDVRQSGFQCALGTQWREQPFLQYRPHPFHLLLAAPRLKFPRGCKPLAMVDDML